MDNTLNGMGGITMIDKEPDPNSVIVARITMGEFDAQLDVMTAAIGLRKAMLGKPVGAGANIFVPQPKPVPVTKKSIYDFKVGDRVRFNQRANPKYLIGTEATVTGRKRTKVTIKLDAAAGRFGGESNITCPTSIIDKV